MTRMGIGVLLVMLGGVASAQDCVELNKICGPPAGGTGQVYPDCCGPEDRPGPALWCQPKPVGNGRCLLVGGVTTTTATTSTQPTTTTASTSTTTTTTDTEPEETTTSTTLQDPDRVAFPALRAIPPQVAWVLRSRNGAEGFAWWNGQFATQPERAAMQGRMITLLPALGRYARRMPSCGQDIKKIETLETMIGTRFMTSSAYEGRVFPPQNDAWTINGQGAGDVYQFGYYRPRDVQACSVGTNAERCALAIDPDVAAYIDVRVVDGACVKANSRPETTDDLPERYNREQGQEGILNGARVFKPLSDSEKMLLHDTHTAHVKVSAARCDRSLPSGAGTVDAAHRAYENALGSRPDADASVQHFARMPDFSGFADTPRNRHPLDPPDTLYWSDEDECDWGKIQDIAHERWMAAHESGKWGLAQMQGRLHQFTHLCMNWRSNGLYRFPRNDGTPIDQVDPMTCEEYLTLFRATGTLP